MIIRYRNSKKELIDYFVFPEEVDYWVDTQKMQVLMEFGGKTRIVFRSKKYDRLTGVLDQIAEVFEKNPDGFLDTTALGDQNHI